MRKLLAVTVLLLAAGSTGAAAQDRGNNELAVMIGRTFISDQGVPNTNFFDNIVRFGKGLTFEGNYARSLRDYSWARLSAEDRKSVV